MIAARSTWQDAYDAQMGLWRWERSPIGQRWLRASHDDVVAPLPDNLREMVTKLYASEPQRVLGADPYFVSDGMCQLVEAAAESFAPEALYPTDLLTASGFIFYERPFEVLDRFDEPLTIAGFSWSPLIGAADEAEAQQARADYALDSGSMLEWLGSREGNVDGLAWTIYSVPSDDWQRDRLGEVPMIPMHMTPWWFGMDYLGNEVDLDGKPTGAAWWWKIAQTTLRLMQQTISARHPQRVDRAQRRRAARLGYPDREVVVVRLRRESGEPSEPSGEPAGYSHRFIVGGHWRQQFYPSAGVHRQIWIGSYVKGPEDAPLIIRPRKAFVWRH